MTVGAANDAHSVAAFDRLLGKSLEYAPDGHDLDEGGERRTELGELPSAAVLARQVAV